MYSVKLEQSGRVLIPAELRKKLRLVPGQDVLLSADDATVQVLGTRAAMLRRLQDELRGVAPGRVLSEVLIADRRAVAVREG